MVILMCTINTMIRGMVDGFTFLIRGTNRLEALDLLARLEIATKP
jgi:hypothetical protein